MLALWMLYTVLGGGAIVTLAALLEARVRRRRRALWVFALLAALAGPPVLHLLPTGGDRSVTVVIGPIRPIVEAPGARVGSVVRRSSERWALDSVLPIAWGGASLLLLGVMGAGIHWTRRRRREWELATIDGVPVLLSADMGPAVVGLRRPVIVIPRWVLDRPEDERRLILAHELEHLRARDPALLAAAFGVAALAPWNVALWWAFLRVRDAVETDCDARVLARGLGAPVRYARLLLESGSRIQGRVPVGAGFGERRSSLERRIRAMLGLDRTLGWKGLATRAALVALVAIAACSLEVNINTRSAEDAADGTASALRAKEIPAPEAAATRPEDPAVPEAEPSGQPEEPAPVRARIPRPPTPVVESPLSEWPGGGAPSVERGDIEEAPTFTPFTVAPSILNRDEVVEAMGREYPPLLREAGIGGTVRIYFLIGADGLVKKRVLDRGSGHAALDDAAMRVAQVFRFSPGLNRDQEVPVWVSFPITFQVR